MKITTPSLAFSLIGLFLFTLTLNSCKTKGKEKEKVETDVFSEADNIISSIKVLEFPDKVFNILDFGAVADGETNNSEAIKKAITACNEAGGGYYSAHS